MGGYVYAVPGGYNQTSQRIEVYGGIYTKSFFTGNQRTAIHFDRKVLTIGKDCPDDEDRCVPLGESCEQTSDCCTPLECNSDGICEEPGIIID